MRQTKDALISGVQNGAYSRVGQERRKDLVGNEAPSLSTDSVKKQARGGCSPGQTICSVSGTDRSCICLDDTRGKAVKYSSATMLLVILI